MNLLFHDIEKTSGFQGKNAEKYKIDSKKFFKIITILQHFDKKKRPLITFDDGGESINSELIKKLIKDFKIKIFIATKYINTPGFLTSEEIIQLKNVGAIIGCHSHNHEDMRNYDSNRFENDWLKSKKILEGLLKKEVTLCSIPYGKFQYWQLKKLQSIGFTEVYTSDNKPVYISNTLSTYPRISIDSRLLSLEIYLLKLIGLSYFKFRAAIIKLILGWI